ncbi:MAG: diguanylate cyclase [Planctomycetota bacterium]
MGIYSVKKEDLAELVFKDELTNLYNRRFFNQYLKEKFDWKGQSLLSLLMIDIDYFKKINDTYGHLEGDNILEQFGVIIKETVGDTGVSIRYAGDEFSVIILSDKKKSLELAQDLLHRVEKTAFRRRDVNAEPIAVSISIGIASFPDDAGAPLELIEQADKALYLSKHQGRNRVFAAGTFSDEDIVERDIFNNFPCPHFIGRQEVSQEIIQYLNPSSTDKNIFILIEEPTGFGKTRLLKELSSYQNAFAFYNPCNEIDTSVPYKPIISFLTTLAESRNSIINEILSQLSVEMLSELKGLIPQLGKNISLSQNVANKGNEQNRKLLFESLVYFLSLLSQKRPLLLLIDEFQNIDQATLLIIEALLEEEMGHYVIVAALRSGSIDLSLNQFLSKIENHKRLSLSCFNLERTAEMISKILPQRIATPSFDEKIQQLTKGNPLFIEEMLKYLMLKNLVKRKGKQWVFDIENIPSDIWSVDIDKIIQENIGLIETETKSVIEKATVIGQDIPLNLLNGVTYQNESETIDALDKAKRFHLIESTDSLKEDRVSFINKHLQEVVYQNIDEKERQALHQNVGEAAEKIYQDELDSAAPALAFHFAKAGDEKKALVYEERIENSAAGFFRRDEISGYYESHQGVIRSKIKEAIQPLSSKRMELIKDLLRNLVSTCKNMRLYPDGSQLITMAYTSLLKLMHGIFEEADIFTFSESKNILQINTVPLDSKNYGAAVIEFLALLKDHYIKNVTFRKGVTEQEIERFLRNLDKSSDKPFASSGYWNKFLDDNGISNIGITQQVFIAKREKGVSSSVSAAQEKIELDASLIVSIKDFFRYFCAAIENIKLYPPGSQLAIEAVKYVNKSIEDVFKHISVLNVGVSEGILLINGTPVNPRLLGSGSVTLAKIIRDYNLKSISFSKDILKEEMEMFIEILSKISVEETKEKSVKDWDTSLAQKNIVNIKIGAMVYVTADTRRSGPPPLGRGFASASAQPSIDGAGMAEGGMPSTPRQTKSYQPQLKKDVSLDEKFANLMRNSPERLLDDDSLQIVEELLNNNDVEKNNQFYQRFLQNLRGSNPEIRSKTHTVYQKLVKKAKPEIQAFLISKTSDIILEEINLEKVLMVYNVLFNSALQLATYYLENDDYNALKAVITTILKRQSEKETPARSDERSGGDDIKYKLFTALKEKTAFTGFLKNSFSPDINIKNTVQEIILLFNPLIIQDLLNLIQTTEDQLFREAVAIIINQLGPEAHQLFINALKTDSDIIEIKRLLRVSHLIQTEDMENVIKGFINDELYEDALYGIARFNRPQALHILLPLLNNKNSVLVMAVLETFGTLKYKESVDSIINLLENANNIEMQKKICKVLVQLQDEKAIPVLAKLLSAKRFWGFIGGVSDEIRGTAAWALGQIQTSEAKQILNLAVNDKSPHVSSMVKLSLKNYEEQPKQTRDQ